MDRFHAGLLMPELLPCHISGFIIPIILFIHATRLCYLSPWLFSTWAHLRWAGCVLQMRQGQISIPLKAKLTSELRACKQICRRNQKWFERGAAVSGLQVLRREDSWSRRDRGERLRSWPLLCAWLWFCHTSSAKVRFPIAPESNWIIGHRGPNPRVM